METFLTSFLVSFFHLGKYFFVIAYCVVMDVMDGFGMRLFDHGGGGGFKD